VLVQLEKMSATIQRLIVEAWLACAPERSVRE
jgi:hypothetical protein